GQTFPFTLLAGTPNDGTQEVTLPDVLTEQARVMVKCSDNIFFNISPADFDIECISNLVVTDDPAIGTYEARQQVATMGTVTVPAAATTEFLAGVEVLLNPGFSALLGCDFLARIQPCNACVGTRPVALAVLADTPEQPVVHIHYLRESEVENRTGVGERQLSVFPNPFDQQFTVRFNLPESGHVYLELVDMTGRLVQQFYQRQYLDAGLYQFSIPAGELTAGLYDCRLVTESGIAQVKLVKLK
ncbi:MAG: T9SS type A sorting domain-containing protein, partial [Bacteroidetes bacterium]